MPLLAGVNLGGAVAGLARSIAQVIGKTIEFAGLIARTVLRLTVNALRYVVEWVTRRAEFIIGTLERLTREFIKLASASPEAMIGAYVFFREVIS